jgi:hypothetical protein
MPVGETGFWQKVYSETNPIEHAIEGTSKCPVAAAGSLGLRHETFKFRFNFGRRNSIAGYVGCGVFRWIHTGAFPTIKHR